MNRRTATRIAAALLAVGGFVHPALAAPVVAVVPLAHKISTLITTMDIWVFDVATGKTIVHASGQIRGDTDEAYAHGVRFLVRNRIVDTQQIGEVPPEVDSIASERVRIAWLRPNAIRS